MIREFWVKFLISGDSGTSGDYYGISDTRPGGRKIKKKGKKKELKDVWEPKPINLGRCPRSAKGTEEKKIWRGRLGAFSTKNPIGDRCACPSRMETGPQNLIIIIIF